MKRLAQLCFTLGLVIPALAAEPNQSGPLKVLTASWLGGAGDEQIVGADVREDLSVVLAINALELKLGPAPVLLGEATPPTPKAADPKKPSKNTKPTDPNLAGHLVRLAPGGQKVLGVARFPAGGATLRELRCDAGGNLFLLGDAPGTLKLAGVSGTGRFIALLTPDAARVRTAVFVANAMDFAVDGNGDFVVLTKGHLTRYGTDGKQKWDVTWPTHGDNRPGGMAVSPQTGIAAVTGYGMTHTGKEPYKAPYGYGFSRDGKLVWSLWNPNPKLLVDKKFGGNGLMADTTGYFAGTDAAGNIFLGLFADGGNSVCTRDPLNVNGPLNASVFDGVFQKSPGHGFKGASKTAVVFRVNPNDGRLEKGTWMSAWLSPQRANGLSMEAVAGDAKGRTFIVGSSAFGCPTKHPWFPGAEGGYQGGGFLAILDDGFKMLQCGYFQGTSLDCVAYRNGHLVVAGTAAKESVNGDKSKPETKPVIAPVPQFKPLQREFGGGGKDGWFAVFKVE